MCNHLVTQNIFLDFFKMILDGVGRSSPTQQGAYISSGPCLVKSDSTALPVFKVESGSNNIT